jgi:hypothetical protein
MTTTTRRHEGSRSAYLGAILAGHMAKLGQEPHAFRICLAVEEMQRATRAAKAWGVRVCNEPMSDAQADRGANRIHKAQGAINAALVEMFGTDDVDLCPRVDLGGDPRGACGRLHIPGQRGDGWGEGFAIYQEGAR